jgi:hypothetical protein
MPLMVDSAIEDVVNERMQDAAWAQTLAGYLRNLNAGLWSESYVALVVQKWERQRRLSIYDAYAFSALHTWMNTGEIARVTIDIGVTPSQDNQVAFNNGVLSELDAPFRATFWGGTQGEDGSFAWTDDVIGQTVVTTDDGVQRYNVVIPPRDLPLEVGYTNGAKSLMQVNRHGGLARWPYGSTSITAMVPVQKEWTLIPDERYQLTLMDYAQGLYRV